jgi:hypothetical protein
MNRTDDLIQGLSGGLKPVKRGGALLPFILFAAIVGFTIALLIALHFHPRADMAALGMSFYLMILAPLLLGALGLVFLREATLSATGISSWRKKYVAAWSGVILYLASVFFYSYFSNTSFLPQGRDLICAVMIAALSLPFWFFSAITGAFLFPTSKWYQRGTALLAFSAGTLIMNLYCPIDSDGHHFFGHGLEALVLSMFVYFVLNPVSQAGIKAFIKARANKLKKSLG